MSPSEVSQRSGELAGKRGHGFVRVNAISYAWQVANYSIEAQHIPGFYVKNMN